MNKTSRISAIQKLVKLQEQMILSEFSELQRQSDELKENILNLRNYKHDACKKLASQSLFISELATIKSFNEKLEQAVEGLQNSLELTDKNYAIVGEKVKSIRTTLLSLERLAKRNQIIEANQAELVEQKQTEEYLNYLQSPLDSPLSQ